MSLRSRDAWIEEADTLLVDGKWHDGLTWMLAVEKHIPPGVARRRTEQDRVRNNLRRARQRREQQLGRPLTKDEIGQLEVHERTRPLSTLAQIAAGKRALVVAFVHTRVRLGTYTVEPWPVPEGGWKQGGWRVRKPIKWSLGALESRYGIALSNVRRLIMEAPALHYEMAGRIMYLPDEELPALESRIKAYREAGTQRRRAAAQERWRRAKAGEGPATHYAVTVLARRTGISAVSAQRLREAHPELGWETRGRRNLLPRDRLAEWERIVKEFNATRSERRREANRRNAQARANANRGIDDGTGGLGG